LTKKIQKIKKTLTSLAMQPLLNLETKEKDKRQKEKLERYREKHQNLNEQ
jgi:hypothetical protein